MKCPLKSKSIVTNTGALAKTLSMTQQQMIARLKLAYTDGPITVTDLTGTEDHWNVEVSSNVFKGMNRVQQHQHVMSQFAKELKTGEVHALTIVTKVI
jgi:stress-induced morphogen